MNESENPNEPLGLTWDFIYLVAVKQVVNININSNIN